VCDLLLVTVVTSFTPAELVGQLEETRNAELLGQERLPTPCPPHLERFDLQLDDDEVGLLLHFIVKRHVAVLGDGPIAYTLEARRQAALQIAGA
jgi:hypothetical protein